MNRPDNPAAMPADPAMAASDPAMFQPLTTQDNDILAAHLRSGWAKQGAVYPVLAEPWKETAATLDDLHAAWQAAREARQAEREPEAGQ
jgi:hypothetical protein